MRFSVKHVTKWHNAVEEDPVSLFLLRMSGRDSKQYIDNNCANKDLFQSF